MNRRTLLMTATAMAIGMSSIATAQGLPPLEQKDRYKVGFAQIESNNPWRLAQTKSFHDTAEHCGWDLVYTDAAGSAAKQVSDVNSMIAQQVDAILLAPREEKPLIPAVMKAQDKGRHPDLILVDRSVDPPPPRRARTTSPSSARTSSRKAAASPNGLVENFKGDKAKIIELEGTTGSSPANDRKKGFDDAIAADPRFEIVASQSGDFARDQGRQVMETLLQAHPDVNIVYAHNDEMAIGAIAALEAAGPQARRGRDRSSPSTARATRSRRSSMARWASRWKARPSSARSPSRR